MFQLTYVSSYQVTIGSTLSDSTLKLPLAILLNSSTDTPIESTLCFSL